MKPTSLLEMFVPRLIWRHRIRTWNVDPGEPEAALLPRLVDRKRKALDVGGADGAYTVSLIPLAEQVLVFEPIPAKARRLRQTLANTRCVSVHEVALSDREGQTTLRVPSDRPWQSTVEASNPLVGRVGITEIAVKRATIDSFEITNVGFMKVDVEGHEREVLAGATKTIDRDRPNVLIEVEERHRPGALHSVFEFFSKRRYEGFFLLGGELVGLAGFDPTIHQVPEHLDVDNRRIGVYINNFVFVPRERAAKFARTA
jgi:FkbM family methyltransferase